MSVACLECGRQLGRITTGHLKLCCGMTWLEYQIKHHVDHRGKSRPSALPEGKLVSCLECGREMVRITTTHLRICCSLTVAEYRIRYPHARLSATVFERTLSIEERHRRRAEYKLQWQRNHSENYKRAMRKWEKANPDKVSARSREWRYRNLDKVRQKAKRVRLRLDFGLSIEQYEMMLDAQNGVCAICKQPETSRGFQFLSVDHSHRTGEIRGLLCNKCNLALGLMQDDPKLLRAAALYLDHFNAIEVEHETSQSE